MNPGDQANRERQLALYLTAEHACSYLTGLRARTLFVDPLARMDLTTYQALVDQGFRRSGAHVYRPACRGCARCVPVRLPVADFHPDRAQRRNWARNAGALRIVESPAVFEPRQFTLYLNYVARRHPEGSMADDTQCRELPALPGRSLGG